MTRRPILEAFSNAAWSAAMVFALAGVAAMYPLLELGLWLMGKQGESK